MKKLFIFIHLLSFVTLVSSAAIKDPVDTNLIMYGRGLYPGDDSTYEHLREAGFQTIVLSSFYIKANGDLYSGDDNKNPIIHNGKYVGDREWLRRVASLKKGSVKRIEILFEGRWYNQPANTFDHIENWTYFAKPDSGIVTGTGVGSTLYNMCKVLKDEVGADAICIDDECVYNSESIAQLGEMIGGLNMHMSLCPFKKYEYWKDIICRSKPGLIDAVYIQCYDGGRRNAPAQWKAGLQSDIPVYPIFLCRGAFSTCSSTHNSKSPAEMKADMIRFKQDYPELRGGAVWQMADVKGYVKRGCAVSTPESGTATTEQEYLNQLIDSLKAAL